MKIWWKSQIRRSQMKILYHKNYFFTVFSTQSAVISGFDRLFLLQKEVKTNFIFKRSRKDFESTFLDI
jgi:ribosomal protein S6